MNAKEARKMCSTVYEEELSEIHTAILRKVKHGEDFLVVNRLSTGAKVVLESEGYKIIKRLGSLNGYTIAW